MHNVSSWSLSRGQSRTQKPSSESVWEGAPQGRGLNVACELRLLNAINLPKAPNLSF